MTHGPIYGLKPTCTTSNLNPIRLGPNGEEWGVFTIKWGWIHVRVFFGANTQIDYINDIVMHAQISESKHTPMFSKWLS